MRVLVVTVVHTPLDARIHHRQIRALRQDDIEVTYLAPWRATGTDPARAAPGVRCLDVPRAVGCRRLTALRAARRRILRLAPDHDLILLHDPELVLAVAGRLRRLPPVVLDVHEDLVAALVDDRPWVPAPLLPLARALVRGLERAADRRLAGLLLAEEAYRARFAGTHPVVPNLPWLPPESTATTDAAGADPHPPSADATQMRVVYVGRLSVGRGVHELLALGAALTVEEDAPGNAEPSVRLELAGTPDADVLAAVRAAHDRGEVCWHGYLPNDEAMTLVRGSLAGLSLLHDLPNYRTSMPTKVVEYLAQGVPAISTPLPEAARLIRESQGGIVVDFADVEAALAAVRRLAADPALRARLGEDGRAYVRDHASWDAVAPRFVAYLRGLAAGRPAP